MPAVNDRCKRRPGGAAPSRARPGGAPALRIAPRKDGEISRVFGQKVLYTEADGAISST